MKWSEPLGLPRGTVRALVTIAFVAVTLFMFATVKVVPVELLLMTGVVVTFYFATRAVEPPAEPRVEKPLYE